MRLFHGMARPWIGLVGALLAALCLVFADQAGAASPGFYTLESFDGNSGWLNSPPLTPSALRGKVVLVDFWEYTCLNCLRTLPYLRTWWRRYKGDGFVIVGVHTPEFRFSGERQNLEAALKRLRVTWPVVMDDDRNIWRRYDNDVWPHELLYDRHGRLVESFEGEGGYPQTEARIQALLKQADPSLSLPPVMPLLPQDSYDKPGAVCYPRTPEILVENERIPGASVFQSQMMGAGGMGGSPFQDANPAGGDVSYLDGGGHDDGQIYLQGYWRRTAQAVVSGGADSALRLPYHAIEVEIVLKPETGRSTRVDVTQDGKPVPKEDAGKDLHYDARGASYLTVDQARAYQTIMNAAFGSHELELHPQGPGVGVYDFAFESCEVPGTTK
jgi:thiol-disulfide isomerase/thioredoxin